MIPRPASPFALVLTGRSVEGESIAEMKDNGQVQTDVCGATKGVRSVDAAARPGRGVVRYARRHRQAGRGCPKRAAGRGRRTPLLGDRGEGAR